MINLKALERSLAKIEAVGHDELDFEAGGIKVVLRPMSASEENEAERYSRTAYEDENGKPIDIENLPESEQTLLNRIWIDRLRQACLAFSICEVEAQDLRDAEFIDTDELDASGKRISRPRYEVMRDLVSRWGRPILTQMFSAYGELTDRINLRASRLVKFDPSEVEEEKRRLKRRLQDLERREKDSLNNDPSSAIDVLSDLTDVETSQQDIAARMRENDGGSEDSAKQNRGQERMPSIKEELKRVREQIQNIPDDIQTPAVDPSQGSQGRPQRATDDPLVPQRPRLPLSMRTTATPPERRQEPPQEPPKPSLPLEGDSFFDPADGDEAYLAESRRQEQMYREKQERDRQAEEARKASPVASPGSRPSQGPSSAVSLESQTGLREALNTGNSVFDGNPGSLQRSQPSTTPTGKRGQTDMYRMPTTTLERRGIKPDPSQIQIDPSPGSRNPRFKAPREE